MAQKCDIFLCLSLFRRSLAALEIFQKKPSNAVQKYFMWRVGSCEKRLAKPTGSSHHESIPWLSSFNWPSLYCRFSQEDSHIFGLRRTRQISGLATCYIVFKTPYICIRRIPKGIPIVNHSQPRLFHHILDFLF